MMDKNFAEKGMWRFSSLLPVDDPCHVVTLGEGDTALLPAIGPTLTDLPIGSVHFKAEYQNPTGSFKDRIAAVAASLISQRDLGGAVGTSSGNGGAAIAAYGARAGFPVVLFTVAGIVDGKLTQILAQGAKANVVDDFGTSPVEDVAGTITQLADKEGWFPFLTGARYIPDAMRGAETIAFEVGEEHPQATAVYVPVGGGGLLGSVWRGYCRLDQTPPRLVGVQPVGCPTLRHGIEGDLGPLDDDVSTTISGLQVPVLFDHGAVNAVIESGGAVTEVVDHKAWKTQKLLAREEGIFVEPAGATALAGVLADVEAGRLGNDDHVVAILSGAGHKDNEAVSRMTEDNPPRAIPRSEIASAFTEIRERG